MLTSLNPFVSFPFNFFFVLSFELLSQSCFVDESLAGPNKLKLWDHFQFERLGFFVADQVGECARVG